MRQRGKNRRRAGLAAGLVVAAMVGAVTVSGAVANAEEAQIRGAGPGAVPGHYTVVLKKTASLAKAGVQARAAALTKEHNGTVRRVYEKIFSGFSAAMSEEDAKRLAAEPDVDFVEQGRIQQVTDAQSNPPSWGLDRIDERALPLSASYEFDTTPQPSTVYIIDTGVRTTHSEFGNRVINGWDFIDDDGIAQDCHGHGTHVAGTIGGKTHGVVKNARMVAVRVFNCKGIAGPDSVKDGIEFVLNSARLPAVINFSIGLTCVDINGNPTACPPGAGDDVRTALASAVRAGINVVVAAGNDNIDACGNPYANVAGTITVGASTIRDTRSGFSNWGSCLDLYAPGGENPPANGCLPLTTPNYKGIVSAGIQNDTDACMLSGTSMAAPHVAAAAAQLLSRPGWATKPPADVRTQLLAEATTGALTGLDPGSPNKLLYIDRPTFDASVVAGDFDADGKSDLALTGASTFKSVPVASSVGDGTFDVRNPVLEEFARLAANKQVKIVSGDFNGDRRTDVLLTGNQEWNSIPVAFATGRGTFDVKNRPVGNFPFWASSRRAQILTGDFNGDGKDDLALLGDPSWSTVPVAFSMGDGTFDVKNLPVDRIAGWAAIDKARVVTGDFNADGKADLAVTGVPGFSTVPVALSKGDGTFDVSNETAGSFPGWAGIDRARVLTGDFNGDRRTDLSIVGVPGFSTVPVAFSRGNGTFDVRNQPIDRFAGWAAIDKAKVLTGDFNADGKTDLAVTGVPGFSTVPVAISKGLDGFDVSNNEVPDFAGWAGLERAKVLTGDFNGDRRTDIALTGVPGWTTIPLALAKPTGGFSIENKTVADFPTWAAPPLG